MASSVIATSSVEPMLRRARPVASAIHAYEDRIVVMSATSPGTGWAARPR